MATKKVATVKKENIIEQTPAKEYSIWIKFNDQEFNIETDDIKEALLAIKPSVLKTRVLLKVKKGLQSCDKILSGMQAKQVFRNKLAMTVFLNRLIFK